jgi:hypothetical protein
LQSKFISKNIKAYKTDLISIDNGGYFYMVNRDAKGTPEILFTKKAQRLVVSMAYPEIIAYLTSTRGIVQAEGDLRDIATKIAKQLMTVWQPKSKSLKKIIKKSLKLIGDTHLKIKILERDQQNRAVKIRIIDKDCVFCPPEIRGITTARNFHFCRVITSYIEAILQILVDRQFPFDFSYDPRSTKVEAETFASRSVGDMECVHLVFFTF